MLDGLSLPSLGDVSLGTIVTAVILLLLSDKLVWHTRLKQVQERCDKWEGIALSALGVANKLTVQAEVTNEVLTRLPDPALTEGGQEKS